MYTLRESRPRLLLWSNSEKMQLKDAYWRDSSHREHRTRTPPET
jgi:hypothetical protein